MGGLVDHTAASTRIELCEAGIVMWRVGNLATNMQPTDARRCLLYDNKLYIFILSPTSYLILFHRLITSRIILICVQPNRPKHLS